MSTKSVAKNQQKSVENKVSHFRNKSQGNKGGYSQWLRQRKVFGYLHSIRDIPNSFPSKISATISVPQGEDFNRDWELFQIVVNDYDTRYFFEEYKRAVEDNDTNVTVKFDVTNIRSSHFIAEEGENKGNIINCWRCTLTNLSNMSVNGDVVYNLDDKISVSAQEYYSTLKN